MVSGVACAVCVCVTARIISGGEGGLGSDKISGSSKDGWVGGYLYSLYALSAENFQPF